MPSKILFSPHEDITGTIILDLKKPFTKPGILVVSLDGKESFEYAPFGAKSNHHIQKNENKFLREREILAQFTNIPAGRHTFTFTFSLGANNTKISPSVNIYQEIKGHGVLDLQCSYSVGAIIYETTSQVRKIEKIEFPIIIKDAPPPSVS